MSRRGLGRGLSALIPSASQESHTNGDVTELAVDMITPNPEQPRSEIGEEEIAEVVSRNDFPTASGLASSASGFGQYSRMTR